MSVDPRTVTVEPITGYHALRMIWQHLPDEVDIHLAFRDMTTYMDQAPQPIHVIVNISSNPRFPMVAVISDVLLGPARHRNMGDWLVVGSNRLAHVIGDIVTRVGQRNNIRWFETEAQAVAYLDTLTKAT